ncbi:MAG: metal ABC transporter permease, partial [Veillonella sp.]|nr:metal ABC transporter permease [Veillonella sp.]
FLVLKGWALMGDAMSHAVFPGVVLAYIIGIPFGSSASLSTYFFTFSLYSLENSSLPYVCLLNTQCTTSYVG